MAKADATRIAMPTRPLFVGVVVRVCGLWIRGVADGSCRVMTCSKASADR